MPEPDEFLLLLAAYGEDIDDWADTETVEYYCGIKYDGAGRPCAYRHCHRFWFTAWLCDLVKG